MWICILTIVDNFEILETVEKQMKMGWKWLKMGYQDNWESRLSQTKLTQLAGLGYKREHECL